MPASSLTVSSAQASVIRGLREQFEKAERIVESAMQAPEIDPDELAKDEIAGKKLTVEQRVALHALQPQRNAPVYLSMAKSLVELKAKLEAGLADDAPKLVRHVVHWVQPREYDRVDLKPRQVIDVKVTDGDAKDQGSTPR